MGRNATYTKRLCSYVSARRRRGNNLELLLYTIYGVINQRILVADGVGIIVVVVYLLASASAAVAAAVCVLARID